MLILRPSRLEDGAAMYRLVDTHGGLDRNTPYAYLLLADDLSDTCVVAEVGNPATADTHGGEVPGGELAGFVLAYRPPSRLDTLFVWQVGVAPDHRGRGVAGRMLDHVLHRHAGELRWLEATVTPSNGPSRALFRSVAARHGVSCDVEPYLASHHFPAAGHEPEERFRIGPFPV